MWHNCFVPRKVSYSCIPQARQVYSSEQVNYKGRVVNRAKLVMDDPKERMSVYHVLDFCLENLSALGKDLKQVYLSSDVFNCEHLIDLSNLEKRD